MSLKIGAEDIELFTKVSGDEATLHLTPDDRRRLVIQGLLTATLPAKIGMFLFKKGPKSTL